MHYGLQSLGLKSVEARNLLFHTHPGQLWGLLSLLYNGYCGSSPWNKAAVGWKWPATSHTQLALRLKWAELYHYSPLCLHGMLFADLYPFNPYSSRSDTSGIKMLIVTIKQSTKNGLWRKPSIRFSRHRRDLWANKQWNCGNEVAT